MKLISRRRSTFLAVCAAASFLAAATAAGAELKPETAAAFDAYIRAAEAQMAADLETGHFLVIDRLPAERRREAYARLHQGSLYIEPEHAQQNGNALRVPNGLVHDWAGVAFIPGATFAQAEAVLADYGDQQNIYKPEVQRSTLLSRDGDASKIALRFYYKSLVTVVLDASFDNQEIRLSSTRMLINSHSTRILEVKNASEPNEYDRPEGKDSGYLWRMATYWRFEARDGGVYLQVETIGLTRSIPPLLVPIAAPLTRSIPRKVLSDFLNDTRAAVVKRPAGSSIASSTKTRVQ